MYIPRWLAAVVGGTLVVLVFAAFQVRILGSAEPGAGAGCPHPSRLRQVTTTVDATGVILAPTSGNGFVVRHIGFATDAGNITTTARPILALDGVPLFVLAASGVRDFGFGFHTDLGSGLPVAAGSVLTVSQGGYVPVGQVVTVLGYVW